MQTTVESTAKHTVKLTVEVPVDEFTKDLDRAYRSIANQVRIPGFRKGKVPNRIIDAQVGRDVVMEEFLSSAVPTYFRDAVRTEDLAPIADPDIELEPVERPIQASDFVTIDVRATVHAEEVPEATRIDYLYFVGSGEFWEKLDAELAGKRAGDILKVNDVLPERFGDSAGSEVTLQVLVKDVKARRLPEADDDFAKTASEFDTLAELWADLAEKLRELKERDAEGEIRDRVLQALIDTVDVELPDSLIEEETEHRLTHARERAERAGLTLDQVLSSQGWDEARLREDSRDHAIRAIKSDLVLEGVARAANLEVTADEIGTEIARLAQAYGRDAQGDAK